MAGWPVGWASILGWLGLKSWAAKLVRQPMAGQARGEPRAARLHVTGQIWK
jgi:hypothetical protein